MSADVLGDSQQMYWVTVSADALCDSQQMYWVTARKCIGWLSEDVLFTVPADVLGDSVNRCIGWLSADVFGDSQQMYWVTVSRCIWWLSADVLCDSQQMYWVTVGKCIIYSAGRCIGWQCQQMYWVTVSRCIWRQCQQMYWVTVSRCYGWQCSRCENFSQCYLSIIIYTSLLLVNRCFTQGYNLRGCDDVQFGPGQSFVSSRCVIMGRPSDESTGGRTDGKGTQEPSMGAIQ